MMLMCPWLSYILASGLQLSGIVSILTNGAFLSYYATPSITQSSKRVLSTIYEVAAYSAETIVFLYLGIGLFAFNTRYYETISWGFCFTTILNLNLARLLNIGIVTYLANLARKESKISYKT
jgi:NhaP-type Na+/H+ or K+/H+ antiporter